ncbi:hypothetical protein LP420_13950 [Massilia sp. B-10]|nr:hypothetical protein LP420_13950 [Massilia sp. B-10]
MWRPTSAVRWLKHPGPGPFAAAVTRVLGPERAVGRQAARQVRHWQQQIEIPRDSAGRAPPRSTTSCCWRAARVCRCALSSGFIVVFDDISDVISAQRSIAWGEVARRLAHEIKNPLTPIQLSAERMQMKLESRLSGPDVELLNKGTATIVNQVDAMKRMVDDFRDYAKAPLPCCRNWT